MSEDNKVCHIHERYAGSEATISHLKTFLQNYAERLLKTGTSTRFEVYGSPSSQAKVILDGFNPVYMQPIGGFSAGAKEAKKVSVYEI